MNASTGRAALRQIDVAGIATRLRERVGSEWDPGRFEQALDGYLAFLSRRLEDPTGSVPPPDVDAVWLAHRDDPARYHADCLAIFGSVLERSPDDEAIERIRLAASRRRLKPGRTPADALLPIPDDLLFEE